MIMAMISASASRGRLPLDALAGVSGNIVRTVRRRLGARMATLPLVGAGHDPVDELGSVNEQPDHSAKQIGDHFREGCC
jgi:hypothetical protein